MAEGREVNRVHNILLLADSRGRGIERLVNNNAQGFVFRVEVEPGANLRKLTNKLLKMCSEGSVTKFNAVIIFAGICNITKIVYVPNRAAVPRYNTDGETLSAFKSECQHLFSEVKDKVHVPIIISPTVGIDLMVYAEGPLQTVTSNSLFKQQPVIDSSVVMINKFIREVNGGNGLPSPNTSYSIHRCRGHNRGYRTHYIKLCDGCHPSDEVKENWSQAFIACCEKLFS